MISTGLTLRADIVQDNIPVEVVKDVWIGSIHSAYNKDALSDRGISHIVNASNFPAAFPGSYTYLNVYLRDKEDCNILGALAPTSLFIESGITKGGVLIHCVGGRSRSAALIAGFLMTKLGYSLEKSVMTLKSVRSTVSINKGFMLQLQAYEEANFDLYESTLVMTKYRLRQLVQRRRCVLENRSLRKRNPTDRHGSSLAGSTNSESEPKILYLPQENEEGSNNERALSDKSNSSKSYLSLYVRQPQLRLIKPKEKAQKLKTPLPNLENVYACKSCGSYIFAQVNMVTLKTACVTCFCQPESNKVDAPQHARSFSTVSDSIAEISELVGNINNAEEETKSDVFYPTFDSRNDSTTSDECSELYYIEYLKWMGDVVYVEDDSGTISCPNVSCRSELGHWAWYGNKSAEESHETLTFVATIKKTAVSLLSGPAFQKLDSHDSGSNVWVEKNAGEHSLDVDSSPSVTSKRAFDKYGAQ